jgi:predicted hydrolase (HD superfamily)
VTRDEALAILHEWTKSEALLRHARMVEIAMRAAARAHGGDEERFGLAGLLHDADYEAWPDEHPKRIVALLRERGDEDLAYAISAHATSRTGVSPRSLIDKALVACDELSGFVHACALVRPERLRGLEPKSVRKKLKSPAFAAKVDRAEIQAGIEALGVDLDAHIVMIVAAFREHEEELGLVPPV